MSGEDFGHLVADEHRRVQRRAGVLVHHRRPLAAERAQRGVVQVHHVLAVEDDPPSGHRPLRAR